MNFDYLILALKNLKHRGIRSWLTLLGIFIGVTAVVSLIGLGAGLQAAVGAQFGIGSTEVISVQAGGLSAYGPPGSGAVNKLTTDDVDAIERLSSVKVAIPRILSSGKMEFNDIVTFGIAASVPDGEKRKVAYEILDSEVEVGRLLKDGDVNKVMLGYNFWGSEDIFGKAVVTGKTVLIQDENFIVVGIMKKTGSLIFDNVVMMNEAPLRDLMDYGDDVDIIAVQVKDKDLMDDAKEDIEKLMRKQRDVDVGEEDFEVSTPEAMMDTVNSVLGGVQAFIIIIASISILVGALGIVNTMTTSVLERRKEIGIMKAIGATNYQVFLQFFFESGLLGFIGGLVGVILGTIVSSLGIIGINNFIGAELGLNFDFVLIGGALFGSFVVGAVAGVVPAMNAAKQDPVEALRG
ncbi:ABC transporter permease [archaeon]|jgi:putative ABC transport system permease protein|nr:ABC transporter permease [archaeon]MBT7128957.1 ABC transporter permease [archaeon]